MILPARQSVFQRSIQRCKSLQALTASLYLVETDVRYYSYRMIISDVNSTLDRSVS